MTWQKTWSVICDGCSCGIDHFTGFDKYSAIQSALSNGTVFFKGKHFCSQACKSIYLKTKLREEK